jgi:hypothetical protein
MKFLYKIGKIKCNPLPAAEIGTTGNITVPGGKRRTTLPKETSKARKHYHNNKETTTKTQTEKRKTSNKNNNVFRESITQDNAT